MRLSSQRERFIDYVFSFYGIDGMYDMSATMSEIERATEIRMLFSSPGFNGDTVDRELVRDIILEMRG